MHRHRLERDDHLYKAFQYFDKDSSGWVHNLHVLILSIMLKHYWSFTEFLAFHQFSTSWFYMQNLNKLFLKFIYILALTKSCRLIYDNKLEWLCYMGLYLFCLLIHLLLYYLLTCWGRIIWVACMIITLFLFWINDICEVTLVHQI